MDKSTEKSYIDTYYGNEYDIIESECPDFIINNKEDGKNFGVEVTELYFNESSARLKNYKNYASNLIAGANDPKTYLHKDDKNILFPVNIKYLNCQNEWVSLPQAIGINYDDNKKIGQKPDYSIYENKIIEIINNKNKKANNYNQNLDYYELLIKDNEDYFMPDNKYALNMIQNSQTLLDVVLKSKFNRVIIITKHNGMTLFIEIGNL